MNDQLKRAIETFNRADYMAAGEQFELLARAADPDLKELVEALCRLAAALHLRRERGGRQGPLNLLSQAMLAIDEMRPARGGVDLARLYDELSAYTDDLRAARRERRGLADRARRFIEARRAPRITLREG